MPKGNWKYLISTIDGDFYGTDDEETAKYWNDNEECLVLVVASQTFFHSGESIEEADPPEETY